MTVHPPVDPVDTECRSLAQMAADLCRTHKLAELKLVLENGKARWSYTRALTGEGEISF